jgi:hypothetical protein
LKLGFASACFRMSRFLLHRMIIPGGAYAQAGLRPFIEFADGETRHTEMTALRSLA